MARRVLLCADIFIIFVVFACVLFDVIAAKPLTFIKGHELCPNNQILLKGIGTISSPRHPGPFSTAPRCTWLIRAPKRSRVVLRFTSLEVSSDPSCSNGGKCQCDYVQIQGHLQGRKNYYQRFCKGLYPIGVISIPSNRVLISFASRNFTTDNRFSLQYWFQKKRPMKMAIKANQLPIKKPSDVTQVTSSNHMTSRKRVTSEHMTSRKRMTSQKDVSSHRGKRSVSNSSGVVITYHEDKEKEKKKEEDADPPDEIVLGPSIPIILIFCGVVGSIAWWQFRSDQKERLRYLKEKVRYEEISNRNKKRYKKKKKQSLREIRMKKLYGDMTRHWQAGTQSQSQGSPRLDDITTKRSFAGRLLELAEKPVSYIRSPRGSRPTSAISTEQEVPLVVMREKKEIPSGHQPPSRPASVLLRDALNMIFGAGENGGEPSSVEKTTDAKDTEEKADESALPQPSIPHIMVRQPSYEDDGNDAEQQNEERNTGSPNSQPPAKEDNQGEPSNLQPAAKPDGIESPVEVTLTNELQQTEPEPFVNGHIPDTGRPKSFEKRLVELLENLKSETEEFRNSDDEERLITDDNNTLPPIPHHTPDPRGRPSSRPTSRPTSRPSSIQGDGKTNCSDLEDFLLNLDKELEQDNDEDP